MTGRLLIYILGLFVLGCTPAPRPLTQSEVQDFVRQYVVADASKTMEMVHHDQTVTSIRFGKIYRGWDAIRTATDESIEAAPREVAIGTIDVTIVGSDTAIAVAPMSFLPSKVQIGQGWLVRPQRSWASTIVVKRTPEGLRLIHEHYSLPAS